MPLGCSRLIVFVGLLFVFTGWTVSQDDRTTDHLEGLRENRPIDVVLMNADIIVRPGSLIKNGVIVIRSGMIQRVGDHTIPIPDDLKSIDLAGKTIYPGFIDAFSEQEVSTEAVEAGAAYWNANIRPQLAMADQYQIDDDLNSDLREQGITARLVAPAGGILKGTSCFVLTGQGNLQQSLLNANVAHHARLTVSRRSSRGGTRPAYPNSPMGAVALARQAIIDAKWYSQANRAAKADPLIPKPDTNDALEALQAVISQQSTVIFDTSNELYFLRADRFSREFGLKSILRGSGFEFRRLDAIAKTGRPILLPVNFPAAPNVTSYETALNVSLETLMEWDIAPENPARVAQAGIPFAFCSSGLSSPKDYLKNIRKAVQRGLSANDALSALTITPAQLLNVEKSVGTIAPGKMANLVITDGELFQSETKILETWVRGARFQTKKELSYTIDGDWELKTTDPNGKQLALQVTIEKKSGSLTVPQSRSKKAPQEAKQKKGGKNKTKPGSKDKSAPDDEVKFKKIGIVNARVSALFDSERFGVTGIAQLTFVFSDGNNDLATGYLTWPGGQRVAASIGRDQLDSAANDDQVTQPKIVKKPLSSEDSSQQKSMSSFSVNYPLGAFGVESLPQVETVFIHNVTIWTCGSAGIIQNGAVVLKNGKILAVGEKLDWPTSKETLIIDGKGMHLTPGIIDCHSHMASDGGINESGQAITSEVRIGDFINCNDINLYRQLAGGVTSSNILHGSANPIGGQNQVIKLRWGMLDEDLKFQQAPQGIKFALGENVKRSRDPDSTRYPRTRMGVQQIFMDQFRAAQGYQQQWKRWATSRTGLPPRRNLELEAIVEILEGKRWIHCHSYRQDEILALIRLLDGFDIRIGTFQHILEGYKVADEMKKHGAMGSAFADWWAYKFEVYDAIPYAGALMHDAGVVVSFNSDDRELARHLNHEAAKAVKYGGVPPEEALKFVTLNPAKQLRIEKYVGSIEKGKHADVVLWNGNPLSTLSRCEKTWVDGKRMFDREVDQTLRKKYAEMKRALVQKVLASGEEMNNAPGGRPLKAAEMWPNYDEFCKCKSVNLDK